MTRGIISIAALLLAACGAAEERTEANQAAAAFVPPPVQAPTPVAGQRNTTPLTAYVGRYPNEAVEGVGFFDRTEVSNALIDLVPRERDRRLVAGRDVVRTPVFERAGRVAAYGCEPHSCGGHNWTLLVAADADVERAAVCYHDEELMGDSSRWTTRRGEQRRPGGCPSA